MRLILIPSRLEWRALVGDAEGDSLAGYRVLERGSALWARCGIGPAAAGIAAAQLIRAVNPQRVLLAGIGGAYPTSDLSIGDVIQARTETFADLGHETSDRLVNLDRQGIAMLAAGDRDWNCSLSCDRLDPDTPWGGFATVSSVTSNRDRARKIATCFDVVCENMEGAAVGHACRMQDVPFSEVRAISNAVGPRNRAAWRIDEALARLKQWLDQRLT